MSSWDRNGIRTDSMSTPPQTRRRTILNAQARTMSVRIVLDDLAPIVFRSTLFDSSQSGTATISVTATKMASNSKNVKKTVRNAL